MEIELELQYPPKYLLRNHSKNNNPANRANNHLKLIIGYVRWLLY